MLANFFFGTFFFLGKKKVHYPPCKGRLCAEGSVGREDEGAVSLPQRGKGDYFACKMVDEVLAKSLILHLSI